MDAGNSTAPATPGTTNQEMRLPSSRVDTARREEIWVSPAISFNELHRVASSRRYLLISPCRDEAQYLRRTLDSVAAQSVPPALWVVVDDGSTDETPAILEEYARRLPYLRVVRRTDRGAGRWGPALSTRSMLAWIRCGWRTSIICASWTWISTCRSATSSS